MVHFVWEMGLGGEQAGKAVNEGPGSLCSVGGLEKL